MIGYVTLGTNDLARGAAFYDALCELLGAKRMMEEEQFIAWASDPEKASLALTAPFDGNPASVGNGSMVALAVETPEQVDAVYNKAIELGATDEGPAGQRNDWFYAGYFRDLDGNKLNVFCLTKPMPF
ncbi:VOC family protein [Aestuariibacter salexigens]|uniref:VOC family protein n=1 Tax=Aestuariibacter salexigens TaxID=226010 RepID=UPI000405AC86|nr:VOC family protein [Aestuariibacter salexigens]